MLLLVQSILLPIGDWVGSFASQELGPCRFVPGEFSLEPENISKRELRSYAIM